MSPIGKWECTACGEWYDSNDEAEICRCHGVRELYVCPICDDSYTAEGECTDCINSHNDTP